MAIRNWTVSTFAALALLLAFAHSVTVQAENTPGKESALKASEITTKLLPEQVFFRGQTAPVQMRNTGGVRFADDFFLLAGLVDNSGYSSEVRQKYQAYFITEVAIEIGGQKLNPGAYGVGFLAGNKFIVMDIGAHDLFTVDTARDAEIKRPVPFQVTGNAGGPYRVYAGREYVELHRSK